MLNAKSSFFWEGRASARPMIFACGHAEAWPSRNPACCVS